MLSSHVKYLCCFFLLFCNIYENIFQLNSVRRISFFYPSNLNQVGIFIQDFLFFVWYCIYLESTNEISRSVILKDFLVATNHKFYKIENVQYEKMTKLFSFTNNILKCIIVGRKNHKLSTMITFGRWALWNWVFYHREKIVLYIPNIKNRLPKNTLIALAANKFMSDQKN